MPSVAVIGGGFSGTMVAVNIARLAGEKVKIYLIEKSGDFARGVAYGTKNLNHLLNVPASGMSAFADNTQHFVEWLQEDAKGFYPRKIYGDYIQSILDNVGNAIEKIQAEAIDLLVDDGAIVTLSDGRSLKTDAVVLALGNLPPVVNRQEQALEKLKDRLFFNPWAQTERLAGISDNAKVLIIGTGLTMVDMAVTLTTNNSQRKIIAVSRHGLLPQPHVLEKPEFKLDIPANITVLEMLKYLRQKVAEAAQKNIPWQSVIDAFRPVTVEIWQALPLVEKRKFIMHLKTYWDTRRHRMSGKIFDKLAALQKTNQLEIRAGRVINILAMDNDFEVTIRARGAESMVTEMFDYIVNCASPESNYQNNELMKNLFAKGLVQNGVLQMGIKTGVNGAVIDKNGETSKRIFALGPMCKGELWETTAVPELRVQAQDLAKAIVDGL